MTVRFSSTAEHAQSLATILCLSLLIKIIGLQNIVVPN